MNHDDTKSRLTGAVEAVCPEFGPALRGRVLEAIAEVPVPHRSRRRLIAALAGAVVVLFALGFVPVPRSGGKGALTRAMAAMEHAQSVFIRQRQWDPDTGAEAGESLTWWGAGGLFRSELRTKGRLRSLQIKGRDSWIRYTSLGYMTVQEFRHPKWAENSLLGYFLDRDTLSRTYNDPTVGTDLSVAEFRESSVWGGTRDIVEVELPGDTIHKLRFEFDPATDRLLSRSEYQRKRKGDAWTLLRRTDEVTWDLDLPEDTWTFTPPAGTKVYADNDAWWSRHPGKPLAVGSTKARDVTLHFIDRDSTGCLYLAVGWRSLGAGRQQWLKGWTARVTDAAGGEYVHNGFETRGIGDGIELLKCRPNPDSAAGSRRQYHHRCSPRRRLRQRRDLLGPPASAGEGRRPLGHPRGPILAN